MFKNEKLSSKTNSAKDGIFDIPLFHHSIIPCPPASPERPSASPEALRCRAGLAMAGRYEKKTETQ